MKRFQPNLKSQLAHFLKPSVTGWGAAWFGAIAAGLMTPTTALAASLNWAALGPPPLNWPSGSLQEEYVINGVTVRLTWTPTPGSNITAITDDPNVLSNPNEEFTGGFGTTELFKIVFDPSTIADNVSLSIEYLDAAGNPVPVENARLIILDVDRSTNDLWQDLVTISGDLNGTAATLDFFSAVNPPPPLTTNPPTPPPTTTPPAAADEYTVEFSGTATSLTATGVYPSVGNVEAPNDTSNGNFVVDFTSAVDQISLIYGNGPDSPTNPASHGIGIFNIFFQPAVIGIAKQAGTSVNNGNGTFTIPYRLVVENFGERPLSNVQVVENLSNTFAAAAGFSVSNPQIVAAPPGFTGAINPSFDGAGNNALLAGTPAARSLDIGQSLTLSFDVTVTPGAGAGGFGPFDNMATVTGQTPAGTPISDESTDGTDPDPNGDNSPVENTPTQVSLSNPGIGVAKQVLDAQSVPGNPDAVEVTYEFLVQNFGSEPLTNVQLVEDLIDPVTGSSTFGTGNFSIVGGPTVTSGGPALVANPSYNGASDPNLLAPGSTLAVGASGTVQVTVQVTDLDNLPAPPPGVYRNQVSASGVGQSSGSTVTDVSTDGTSPDPDGDGNPNNNSEPTPLLLPLAPEIGVAKRVVSAGAEPGGAFGADTIRVVYEVVVANIGSEALDTVQLTENLEPTYGSGSFDVVSVAQTGGVNTIALNGSFNGSSDPALLDAGSSTLTIGESATLQLTVDVNQAAPTLPVPLPGPYENQVAASAEGVTSGVTTEDLSNDGAEAAIDPNGNGEANEPGENQVTPVVFAGDFQVVKRITNVFRNGTPLSAAALGGDPAAVVNDGATNADDELIAATGGQLPVGLAAVPNVLTSGDQVEYTVYFFNNGIGTVTDVQLCDELQPPSVYVPGSLGLAGPVALPGPLPAFADSPLLDLRDPLTPLEASCPNAPGAFPIGPPGPTDSTIGVGAGGGFIVGGPGFSVDQNNLGAVRFRIAVP